MELRINDCNDKNKYRTIELTEEDLSCPMFSALMREYEGRSSAELQHHIQQWFDANFDHPIELSDRRYYRHADHKRDTNAHDDHTEDDVPFLSRVFDDRLFFSDDLERERGWAYEECIDWLREALQNDKNYEFKFDLVYSHAIEGESLRDIAARYDMKWNTVNKTYARLIKKLSAFAIDRPFSPAMKAYSQRASLKSVKECD